MRFVDVPTLLLAVPLASHAVILGPEDDSANGATPPFLDPGFTHMATRDNLSGVYLGDGVVLTAHHVGAGDVVIGGTAYTYLPDSVHRLHNPDGSDADLLLFEIHPRPELPLLEIAETTPPYGSLLLVMGHGRNRGPDRSWDPNGPYPPSMTAGYDWASGFEMRWGTNYLEVYPPGQVFGTRAFGSHFDPDGSSSECQAAPGDSGGAAFAWNPEKLDFDLAGIVIAIVEYADQPSQTTFFGQSTYYADLAYYREEIEEQIALPEPRSGLVWGLTLLALLRRRRGRPR